MRGDTCPVASGMGDGTRTRSCGEGLAGACRGSWSESVFCSACLCWGCRPAGAASQTWNWRAGLGVQGCGRVPAPVRLGGKLPPGKWEPDTLGGTGASCCSPFSKMQVCKILLQSHLRKLINPFIRELLLFPSSWRRWLSLLRELQGGRHTTGLLLSFRIPVVVLLSACRWLMIKYSCWIVTEFWVLANGVDEDVQNLPMVLCTPASAGDSWRSS